MIYFLLVICFSLSVRQGNGACEFLNPLFPEAEPDPWFTFHDGFYYYSRAAGFL